MRYISIYSYLKYFVMILVELLIRLDKYDSTVNITILLQKEKSKIKKKNTK